MFIALSCFPGLLRVRLNLSKHQEKRHPTIAESFEQLQRPAGVSQKDLHGRATDKASYYRELLEIGNHSDTESILLKFRRLESSIVSTFEDRRKDKDWIIDFCSLGPAVVAPDVVQSMSDLNDQCIAMIENTLVSALEEKIFIRRWSLTRRLVDIFQVVIKSTSESAEKVKDQVIL